MKYSKNAIGSKSVNLYSNKAYLQAVQHANSEIPSRKLSFLALYLGAIKLSMIWLGFVVLGQV